MKKFVKQLLKNTYFSLSKAFVSGLTNRASILMYHSIGHNKAFFTVRPEEFEKQMKYLHEHGFIVVKLSELVDKLRRKENISNHVAITFDDGYADNCDEAFPILKKYRLEFTVFVATDFIGRSMTNSEGVTIPIMDDSKLQELVASGLAELMPHTASHKPLTMYANDSWKADIDKSHEYLVQSFHSSADIFAYPKGKFMKTVPDYLAEKGYIASVGVEEGLIRSDDDLFKLKRNSVDSTTSMTQFKGKLSKAIEWYVKCKPGGLNG